MNRKSKYFISLCFSLIVLWYGIKGMKAAQYMIYFLTWFGVSCCILAMNNKEIHDRIIKEGRPVPVWISTPITIVFIIILLYYGWIWTAFGYTISLILSYDLYKNNIKS
jgi:hypothetical protein